MYKIIGGDGREYGPVTEDGVRQWIAEGRANAQTMARLEGDAGWKPLSSFPEFAGELGIARIIGSPGEAGAAAPGDVPAVPRTNPMAIAGLIFGIVSVTFGWACCGLTGVLGIIFSAVGMSQINNNPTVETGKGMAVAGLVLSILGLLLGAGFNIVFMLLGAFDEIGR